MAKEICVIYVISNSINDKVYVGQTWRGPKKRFWYHCNDDGCPKIHRAINKYGKENFTIMSMCSVLTQEDANFYEIYFIQKYDSINNGYNLKLGGDGGKHSEETKKKMSVSHQSNNFKHSEETKQAISAGRLGSNNPCAKLTEKQAIEIKILLAAGKSATSIGAYYTICREGIRDICTGKIWGHLQITKQDTLESSFISQFKDKWSHSETKR